jgi:hypothetical protein
MLRSLVRGLQRFGVKCRLHIQGWKLDRYLQIRENL